MVLIYTMLFIIIVMFNIAGITYNYYYLYLYFYYGCCYRRYYVTLPTPHKKEVILAYHGSVLFV